MKNTTVEEKSYGNTIYYYSLKDKKSVRLFDVKHPVSWVSGNRDVVAVCFDRYDGANGDVYYTLGKVKNVDR